MRYTCVTRCMIRCAKGCTIWYVTRVVIKCVIGCIIGYVTRCVILLIWHVGVDISVLESRF